MPHHKQSNLPGILLALTLLAACTTPPVQTQNLASPTGAPPAAAPPVQTQNLASPTAAPPTQNLASPTAQNLASPTALTIWAAIEAPRALALRPLLDRLAGELGVQINLTGRGRRGLGLDVRAARLAGDPLPDLFWGTQADMALLQRDDLLQPAMAPLPTDDYLPAVISAAEIAGQRWGEPLAAQGFLLQLYNKKLVASPATTTDELIVTSRAQVGADRYGLVAAWAEPRWLAAWLTAAGGTFVDANGKPALDTPQMITALNLLRELRTAGPPPPSSYQQGVALFGRGQAAFAIDGEWALDGYRQLSDTLELGIAPLPRLPATGLVAAPPLDGVYLLYGKQLSGEKLQQAQALAAALRQPATQAQLAGLLELLPASRAALAAPEVINSPVLAAAAAQLTGASGLPAGRGLRCAWQAAANALPAVLTLKLTQGAAAQQMQAEALACAGQ